MSTRLGRTATEKYGTDAGSMSARSPVRSPAIVARSTYRASASLPDASNAPRTAGNVRPSFITTAVSVAARRAVSSSSGSVPGRIVRISSPSTRGCRAGPPPR